MLSTRKILITMALVHHVSTFADAEPKKKEIHSLDEFMSLMGDLKTTNEHIVSQLQQSEYGKCALENLGNLDKCEASFSDKHAVNTVNELVQFSKKTGTPIADFSSEQQSLFNQAKAKNRANQKQNQQAAKPNKQPQRRGR